MVRRQKYEVSLKFINNNLDSSLSQTLRFEQTNVIVNVRPLNLQNPTKTIIIPNKIYYSLEEFYYFLNFTELQNFGTMDNNRLNFYLIPGMGADHRLYSQCELKYGNVHYLDWIPAEKSRSLSEYASLLAKKIKTENNIIIGSSMGGMITVELARQINPLAAILISAPIGRHEFPRVLKVFDFLKIHRAVGPNQLMKISRVADLFMGFKTKEQRALFYEMLKGNGPEFLHFSVNAVLGWKNVAEPNCPFIQILGTQDKLFKSTKIKNAIVVEGGGHFTAFEKAVEISEIINRYTEENFLNKK